MSEILVNKHSETFVSINAEPSISRELGDYFTITIPGYHGGGRYKRWNGKIKMFKQREKTLYRGLLPYLETFAKDQGYNISYEDTSLSHTNNISAFEIEEFCKSLNLPLVPHKHQIDSITHALRNKRITLVSPTASGKSLILYVLIRALLPKHPQKILLIVPTTNLCHQMYGDFQDYSNKNQWSVQDNVSIIMQGYTKYPKKQRLKIELENGKIKIFTPNQKINTQRGYILAQNLLPTDEII